MPSGYRLPVTRGGNSDDLSRRLWRREMRWELWKAIKATEVPGLEERESVTICFQEEFDDDGVGENQNPKIAYVIFEGFEDREDRPVELRRALARALGLALLKCLPTDWSVEVFPKRYNSEREGAVIVGQDTKVT